MVPAGDYLAFAQAGEGVGSVPVEVVAGAQQTLSIPIEAARVGLQLQAEGGSVPLPHTWFSVYRIERDAAGRERRQRVYNDGYYSSTDIVLPSGEYIAFARADRFRGERAFVITPGSNIAVDILAAR